MYSLEFSFIKVPSFVLKYFVPIFGIGINIPLTILPLLFHLPKLPNLPASKIIVGMLLSIILFNISNCLATLLLSFMVILPFIPAILPEAFTSLAWEASERLNFKSIGLPIASVTFFVDCFSSINFLLVSTLSVWIVSGVASKANSSAKVSANASFLVPFVDAPTSLPKKFLINSALDIFFFSKIALPWAVFSLSCLPFLSNTGSLKALNLLFITSWGIASYIASKLSLKKVS